MWQIAGGVAIGMLVANLVTWAAVEFRLRWELHQASVALQRMTAAQRAAQQAASAQAREAAAEEQAARRRALAQAQHDAEANKRERAAEVTRREQAWQRFYRPSTGCVESTVSVDCANEHIRFKREFEKRYAAGEL